MRLSLCTFALLCTIAMSAQTMADEFRRRSEAHHSEFTARQESEWQEFRRRANERFAAMMGQPWEEFMAQEPHQAPKQERPVKPVVAEEAATSHMEVLPIQEIEIRDGAVVEIPAPAPQPEPIAPVEEIPQQTTAPVRVQYYGTPFTLDFPDPDGFHLSGLDEDSQAEAWRFVSDELYDNTVAQAIKLRKDYQLCDWSYLQLVKRLTEKHYGARSNEAVFMQMYLLTQSGYKVRLARSGEELHLLFACQYTLIGYSYFRIGGVDFYDVTSSSSKSLSICSAMNDKEKQMSMQIRQPQRMASAPKERVLTSKRGLTATIHSNTNLINFYNDYPKAYIGDNPTTIWAAYANTPLPRATQKELYPVLAEKVKGLGKRDAVGQLLNFVQTAFVYEFDDKVWGGDRVFFAAETLYYPYCDCEDRAILFSRLVRDILNMNVVLIYYPGHLAAAVDLSDEAVGDCVNYKGRKYTICDPTYINAGPGRTMPGCDNATAQVIVL